VEFVRFCIERAQKLDPTRALDILCRPWAPDPDFLDQADRNPAHWRLKFTHKKSYNGKEEMKDGQFVLQSPRASKEANQKNSTGEANPSSADDGDVDTLPSWIQSKSLFSHEYEHEGKGEIKMERRNPDPLVGIPSQHLYSASGSRGVTKNLEFQDGRIKDAGKKEHNHHYNSIFVEGFVLGTIEELGERSQKGLIPKTWADLCKARASPTTGSTKFWDSSRSSDFGQTLIGGQSWIGRHPP
jgi:hypothetical protein